MLNSKQNFVFKACCEIRNQAEGILKKFTYFACRYSWHTNISFYLSVSIQLSFKFKCPSRVSLEFTWKKTTEQYVGVQAMFTLPAIKSLRVVSVKTRVKPFSKTHNRKPTFTLWREKQTVKTRISLLLFSDFLYVILFTSSVRQTICFHLVQVAFHVNLFT